jgi:hypothetical protein
MGEAHPHARHCLVEGRDDARVAQLKAEVVLFVAGEGAALGLHTMMLNTR